MQVNRMTLETVEILRAATRVIFVRKYNQRYSNAVVACIFTKDSKHPFIACIGRGDMWAIHDIDRAKVTMKSHNKAVQFIDRTDIKICELDELNKKMPLD